MISKFHKIPDKFIFRLIFLSIILWNLKYFFLIAQVPFTLFFVDYIPQNAFYSQITDIKNTIKTINDFQDEGKIGFVCETQQFGVFDFEAPIRNFYTTQYAIVPSILKNDALETYVIGAYEKEQQQIIAPDNYKFLKKINNKTYIFKRIEE